VLSSWKDFDFSILFLSNKHKRNPKWKAGGADSPKLHIKRTQKIGWWEKSPSDSGASQTLRGGVLEPQC